MIGLAGDYLAVTDNLPTPSAGQGHYYVTAVNHMGEKRYGRQRTNGTLTGRDPAELPGCDNWVRGPKKQTLRSDKARVAVGLVDKALASDLVNAEPEVGGQHLLSVQIYDRHLQGVSYE